MKKKIVITASIVIMVIIAIFFCRAAFIHWAFHDIQRIEGGEKIAESVSPNGSYTVTIYLNNGGATTDYSILGNCKDNDSGLDRNIYWAYRESNAEIYWVDNDTIFINGKKLNVISDEYDWRKK